MISERVYRALLLAYPSEHRREYGEPMAQLFADSPGHRQRHPGVRILQRRPVPGPGQNPALRGPCHLPDQCVLL